jgi:hypothetical protein
MSDVQVGITPLADAGRDAIHIAIIPVTAAETLKPGQVVTISMDDGPWAYGALSRRPEANPIGVIDPFLDKPVKAGERCWLFLNPRTITSLRHVWSHPDFPEEEMKSPVSLADAKERIREVCTNAGVDDTLFLRAAMSQDLQTGDYDDDGIRINSDYVLSLGRDANGDIPNSFWDDVEAVTGKKFRHRPSYFACSC